MACVVAHWRKPPTHPGHIIMYESFYGLKADPFRLSADHRFCFNHPSYIKAKGSVQYALYRAEGFVMITGWPGTGKTTPGQ
jgi:type II secretory pathway predicted ATPase ExeA